MYVVRENIWFSRGIYWGLVWILDYKGNLDIKYNQIKEKERSIFKWKYIYEGFGVERGILRKGNKDSVMRRWIQQKIFKGFDEGKDMNEFFL